MQGRGRSSAAGHEARNAQELAPRRHGRALRAEAVGLAVSLYSPRRWIGRKHFGLAPAPGEELGAVDAVLAEPIMPQATLGEKPTQQGSHGLRGRSLCEDSVCSTTDTGSICRATSRTPWGERCKGRRRMRHDANMRAAQLNSHHLSRRWQKRTRCRTSGGLCRGGGGRHEPQQHTLRLRYYRTKCSFTVCLCRATCRTPRGEHCSGRSASRGERCRTPRGERCRTPGHFLTKFV